MTILDIVATLYRFLGGGLLGFFAFIPAWVAVHLAPSLIDPAEHEIPSLLLALAGCFALTYFLGLLSYRAFTGRGRKSDGGLLPPWAMIAFIVAFGACAAAIIALGIYKGDIRTIVGGVEYISSAGAAYGVVKWRRARRATDAKTRLERP